MRPNENGSAVSLYLALPKAVPETNIQSEYIFGESSKRRQKGPTVIGSPWPEKSRSLTRWPSKRVLFECRRQQELSKKPSLRLLLTRAFLPLQPVYKRSHRSKGRGQPTSLIAWS